MRRILSYEDSRGVRLADSPGILAWDLMNEPRGAARAWTERMAGFVASLDQRHLVTIGAEGFRDGYPADAALAAGSAGSGFADLCSVPAITLCSTHLFPKYLSNPTAPPGLTALLQHWRADADAAGKPILVEELGYSLSDGGDAGARAQFYAAAGQAVRANDLDGALLWNLGQRADRSFTLSFADPAAAAELSRWPKLIAQQ